MAFRCTLAHLPNGNIIEMDQPNSFASPHTSQYNTSIGMMIGIRVSLRRQQFVHFRAPTEGDFDNVVSTDFPPTGSDPSVTNPLEVTPAHSLKDRFFFKDYAPKVFAGLRAAWGIDSDA